MWHGNGHILKVATFIAVQFHKDSYIRMHSVWSMSVVEVCGLVCLIACVWCMEPCTCYSLLVFVCVARVMLDDFF